MENNEIYENNEEYQMMETATKPSKGFLVGVGLAIAGVGVGVGVGVKKLIDRRRQKQAAESYPSDYDDDFDDVDYVDEGAPKAEE